MIYTSYLANAGRRPNAIAICNGTRGFPEIIRYRSLAPEWDDVKAFKEGMPWREFAERYMAKLNGMNAKKTAAELYGLARGLDPILVCWEKAGEPCHRILVAEWLKLAGVAVQELAVRIGSAKVHPIRPPQQGILL